MRPCRNALLERIQKRNVRRELPRATPSEDFVALRLELAQSGIVRALTFTRARRAAAWRSTRKREKEKRIGATAAATEKPLASELELLLLALVLC